LATEARVFAGAGVLCALYVLDYAFLDRQPGTTASGHLISGLLPAGLLALAPTTATKWLQLVPWFAVATPVTAMFADRRPPPSLTSLIPRIAPRAVLLIWAGHGAGEDVDPHYFGLAGSPKAIWEIPEAGHAGGLTARPAEYEQRVRSFFDRTLLKTGAA
jgi:hypothetical protein